MRINDHQVIQLIDVAPGQDRLVFVDDPSGEEVVVEEADWPAMRQAISYLTGGPTPLRDSYEAAARKRAPRAYTRGEIVNGTGFKPGTMFIQYEAVPEPREGN